MNWNTDNAARAYRKHQLTRGGIIKKQILQLKLLHLFEHVEQSEFETGKITL